MESRTVGPQGCFLAQSILFQVCQVQYREWCQIFYRVPSDPQFPQCLQMHQRTQIETALCERSKIRSFFKPANGLISETLLFSRKSSSKWMRVANGRRSRVGMFGKRSERYKRSSVVTLASGRRSVIGFPLSNNVRSSVSPDSGRMSEIPLFKRSKVRSFFNAANGLISETLIGLLEMLRSVRFNPERGVKSFIGFLSSDNCHTSVSPTSGLTSSI